MSHTWQIIKKDLHRTWLAMLLWWIVLALKTALPAWIVGRAWDGAGTTLYPMLELADLKPGEKLYDLGSGDGRILITAVVRFKAKAVGVEISDVLVASTNDRIRRLGLDNDARVIHGNFLDADLSPADVVTLYLATDANELLRPNLEKFLRNGARVVSHEYAMPGWKPKLVEKDPERHGHTIFLYEMPPKKK